jgi:hypothetical protein
MSDLAALLGGQGRAGADNRLADMALLSSLLASQGQVAAPLPLPLPGAPGMALPPLNGNGMALLASLSSALATGGGLLGTPVPSPATAAPGMSDEMALALLNGLNLPGMPGTSG